MEKTKNKKGIIIGIAVLAVLVAVFAAVYFLAIDKPVGGEKNIATDSVNSDEPVSEASDYAAGSVNSDKPISKIKNITVEVVHLDKTVNTVEISTEAEFLRQALEEKNLVEGTESVTGLFVLTADGETADETQQQWWCFTKNGEMLMTGVDSTPIEDGDKFEITFTVGW